METVCAEDLPNCPREACAVDVKDKSGKIEIDQNSIQCMYLYPQSTQEDVQQTESTLQETAVESEDGSKKVSQNTLELDHEIQGAADTHRLETESPDNRPFIAVRAENSKYCPGCPYELNPNLPGLAAFGAQALDVMDRLGQHDFKYKLIRIVKITRAVPAGSNVVRYELLAEIGESNCLKTTLTERSECSLQASIPLRWCLVTFEERPWQQSDRQVVGNNCTERSDLENEINGGLAVNGARESQPERVDSVQEVIGKTAHIDQLAQEGKIGTYDSLIDELLDSPVSNATPDVAVIGVASPNGPSVDGTVSGQSRARDNDNLFLRGSADSLRRDADQRTDDNRPIITEVPFVKIKLEREEITPQFHGFVDKQREFDEFLEDFDIPIRDTATANNNGEGRQVVTEEIIRPQRVGIVENASSPSSSSSDTNDSGTDEHVVNSQREKRSAVTKAPDSDNLFLKKLAQKAIDTLDDIDEDDDRRVVISIVDVKKEKVKGFSYHLILEVALTDCREKDKNEDDQDCLERISGPVKVCKIQIHTDENNSLFSARVVKSECLKKLTMGKNVRNKRSFGRPGAARPISNDDPAVKNFTNLGLQKFSESYTGPNEPILVEIVSATRQVVQGSLYKIQVKLGPSNCPKGTTENCQLQAGSESQECEIKAWSRPWLADDSLRIEVDCDSNKMAKRSVGRNARSKRAVSSLGGSKSVNISDPKIQNYAQMGLQKFSKTLQGPNEPILIEVVSATRQVVQGIIYKIKVIVGTSNCSKGTKENCQLQAGSEPQECEIKAWSRTWLADDALRIEVDCKSNEKAKRNLRENSRKRRNTRLVGGQSPVNVDEEGVRNYTSMGLQKISEKFSGSNEPILVETVSVTEQVVQGKIHRILVKVGESNCPKGKRENCQLKAGSELQEWEIRAWSRPWIAENPLDIQVTCNCNSRTKRSLRGKNYSQKMLEQSTYLKNERLFSEFTTKYNKTYSTGFERKNRFKIFQQNMLMVQELQRNEQGTAIYGPTMFADLTTEEFREKYLGLRPELRVDNEIPIPMAEIPNIAIPDSYDWRDYNAVTPVKNQGQCGSCWAFSVTGNVEGQYALRHGSLLSFSEQELVDCDTLDEGCNGGLPDNAYRAIEKLGGLELESDYPYEAEGETCHFNKTEVRVKVVSAVNITSNETQMAQWLVQNGPISIGINANAMQFYVGGVSHPFKFLCNPSNLDHGVLIVGYGTHSE